MRRSGSGVRGRSGEQVGKVMRNGGGSVQCVLVTCLVPRVLAKLVLYTSLVGLVVVKIIKMAATYTVLALA